MLSRVADSLYWMSRYLERAERAARLIDVNLNMMLDQSFDATGEQWSRLKRSLRTPVATETVPDAFQQTEILTFDAKNPQSLASCVTLARENARQVREQISSEMWEQLNRVFWQVKQSNITSIWQGQPHEFFRVVKDGAHLFQGITDGTMSHGEGWHFIQLGRYLERAIATATVLDVHFTELLWREHASSDYLLRVQLLKSCTAFEAYCQVYTADLREERIAEFLLLNAEFPQSVRFAADLVQVSLQAIGRSANARRGSRPERLAGRLCAALDYGQVDEIMADNIHAYLEDIQRQCGQIHSAIHQVYIAYPIEAALAS